MEMIMVSDEERKSIFAGLRDMGFKGDMHFDEPLYLHSTLKLGGPSDIFLIPHSTPDVRTAIRFLNAREMPWAVLGGGSNILFPDYGYAGGIIKIGDAMAAFEEEENRLFTGAGMPLSRLMKFAIQEGYGGFDFLVGIPGTIGGALSVNAGTRDQWFNSLVLWVETVNSEGDPVRFMNPTGGYRASFFTGNEYIVTGVALRYEEANPDAIRGEMARRMHDKVAAQPYGVRSAGCVFKNPEGLRAWELIESVGLRGHREGGAVFSEKHCNFIICNEGATSADVLALINLAKERVASEKGIELQRELVLLGFDIPRTEPELPFEETPVEAESEGEPEAGEPAEPAAETEPEQAGGDSIG